MKITQELLVKIIKDQIELLHGGLYICNENYAIFNPF